MNVMMLSLFFIFGESFLTTCTVHKICLRISHCLSCVFILFFDSPSNTFYLETGKWLSKTSNNTYLTQCYDVRQAWCALDVICLHFGIKTLYSMDNVSSLIINVKNMRVWREYTKYTSRVATKWRRGISLVCLDAWMSLFSSVRQGKAIGRKEVYRWWSCLSPLELIPSAFPVWLSSWRWCSSHVLLVRASCSLFVVSSPLGRWTYFFSWFDDEEKENVEERRGNVFHNRIFVLDFTRRHTVDFWFCYSGRGSLYI